MWQPTEVIAFASDCVAHGVKAVSLGGGEPFEYDGVFDVIDALYPLCYLSVTSNGLPLENDKVWERLVKHKSDKIHITNGVHLMGQITLLATSILIQHKCDINKMAAWNGVSLIADEILVETIIATISQITADAGAFVVEIGHIKHHARLKPTTRTVSHIKHNGNSGITDVVIYLINKIGLAGMQQVGSNQLLALNLVIDINRGTQIAHILQLRL